MIVFVVTYNCCIRVVKETAALKRVADAEVHHIGFTPNRNGFAHTMTPYYQYQHPQKDFIYQIEQAFKITQKVDMFHVHNEPNWMAVVLKKKFPQIPLVFDCHDLDLARDQKPTNIEVEALLMADGLIFPSDGYRDLVINQSFGGALKNKPHAVIYSQCNQEIIKFISKIQKPRLAGIVYEGKLINDENSHYPYRNHLPFFQGLIKKGINVFAYPSNPHVPYEYFEAGISLMPTLPYMDLMMELTRYDWGFVGGALQCVQRDRAMPNKLFEYITAGIPVLAMNVPEVENFINEYDLGVVVKTVNDIKRVYGDHEKYRKNVCKLRSQISMENQVDKIVKLYKEAEEECKKQNTQLTLDIPKPEEESSQSPQPLESAVGL